MSIMAFKFEVNEQRADVGPFLSEFLGMNTSCGIMGFVPVSPSEALDLRLFAFKPWSSLIGRTIFFDPKHHISKFIEGYFFYMVGW